MRLDLHEWRRLSGLEESRKVLVYADPTSRHVQPPGLIDVHPEVARIMRWDPLGWVVIPSHSGVRDTKLSDLEGIPVAPLSAGRVKDLDRAYEEGATFPPLDIQVRNGRVHLIDGHHRLAFARRRRLRSVLVNWHIG